MASLLESLFDDTPEKERNVNDLFTNVDPAALDPLSAIVPTGFSDYKNMTETEQYEEEMRQAQPVKETLYPEVYKPWGRILDKRYKADKDPFKQTEILDSINMQLERNRKAREINLIDMSRIADANWTKINDAYEFLSKYKTPSRDDYSKFNDYINAYQKYIDSINTLELYNSNLQLENTDDKELKHADDLVEKQFIVNNSKAYDRKLAEKGITLDKINNVLDTAKMYIQVEQNPLIADTIETDQTIRYINKNKERQELLDKSLTFAREFKESDIEEYLPFISSYVEARDLLTVRRALQRVNRYKFPERKEYKNNASYLQARNMYLEDLNTVSDFETQMVREAQATIGGKIAGGIIGLVPFIGEIIATSGSYNVTKKAVTEAVEKTLKTSAKKGIKSLAIKAASTAIASLPRTALMPTRIAESTLRRGFELDEKGKLQLKDIDVFKGFMDIYIENLSEVSGEALGKALVKGPGFIVSNTLGKTAVGSKLIGKLDDLYFRWAAKVANPTLGKFRDYLQSVGINNLAEEVLEERFGGFLRGVVNIEGEDKGIYKRVKEQTIPKAEEFLVELGVLSVPGGVHLGISTVNKAFERADIEIPLRPEQLENAKTINTAKDEAKEKLKQHMGLETTAKYNKKTQSLDVKITGMTDQKREEIKTKIDESGYTKEEFRELPKEEQIKVLLGKDLYEETGIDEPIPEEEMPTEEPMVVEGTEPVFKPEPAKFDIDEMPDFTSEEVASMPLKEYATIHKLALSAMRAMQNKMKTLAKDSEEFHKIRKKYMSFSWLTRNSLFPQDAWFAHNIAVEKGKDLKQPVRPDPTEKEEPSITPTEVAETPFFKRIQEEDFYIRTILNTDPSKLKFADIQKFGEILGKTMFLFNDEEFSRAKDIMQEALTEDEYKKWLPQAEMLHEKGRKIKEMEDQQKPKGITREILDDEEQREKKRSVEELFEEPEMPEPFEDEEEEEDFTKQPEDKFEPYVEWTPDKEYEDEEGGVIEPGDIEPPEPPEPPEAPPSAEEPEDRPDKETINEYLKDLFSGKSKEEIMERLQKDENENKELAKRIKDENLTDDEVIKAYEDIFDKDLQKEYDTRNNIGQDKEFFAGLLVDLEAITEDEIRARRLVDRIAEILVGREMNTEEWDDIDKKAEEDRQIYEKWKKGDIPQIKPPEGKGKEIDASREHIEIALQAIIDSDEAHKKFRKIVEDEKLTDDEVINGYEFVFNEDIEKNYEKYKDKDTVDFFETLYENFEALLGDEERAKRIVNSIAKRLMGRELDDGEWEKIEGLYDKFQDTDDKYKEEKPPGEPPKGPPPPGGVAAAAEEPEPEKKPEPTDKEEIVKAINLVNKANEVKKTKASSKDIKDAKEAIAKIHQIYEKTKGWWDEFNKRRKQRLYVIKAQEKVDAEKKVKPVKILSELEDIDDKTNDEIKQDMKDAPSLLSNVKTISDAFSAIKDKVNTFFERTKDKPEISGDKPTLFEALTNSMIINNVDTVENAEELAKKFSDFFDSSKNILNINIDTPVDEIKKLIDNKDVKQLVDGYNNIINALKEFSKLTGLELVDKAGNVGMTTKELFNIMTRAIDNSIFAYDYYHAADEVYKNTGVNLHSLLVPKNKKDLDKKNMIEVVIDNALSLQKRWEKKFKGGIAELVSLAPAIEELQNIKKTIDNASGSENSKGYYEKQAKLFSAFKTPILEAIAEIASLATTPLTSQIGSRKVKEMDVLDEIEGPVVGERKKEIDKEIDSDIQLGIRIKDLEKIDKLGGERIPERSIRKDIISKKDALKSPLTGIPSPIRLIRNFFKGALSSRNIKPEYLARVLGGYKFKGYVYNILGLQMQRGLNIVNNLKKNVTESFIKKLEKEKLGEATLAKLTPALGRTWKKGWRKVKRQIVIFTEADKELRLTPMELVDIALAADQKKGKKHILSKGIVLPPVSIYERAKEIISGKPTIYRITEKDLNKILEKYKNDPTLVKIGKIFREVIDEEITPKLNEVSRKLKGIEVAKVEAYWHLETYNLRKPIGKHILIDINENQGRLQKRSQGTAPLIIRDALSRFFAETNAVSGYVGMTIPIRQASYILSNDVFRKTLQDKGYNREVEAYIEIIDNARKGAEDNTAEAVTRWLRSTAAKGILTLNPGVIVVQNMSSMNYPIVLDRSAFKLGKIPLIGRALNRLIKVGVNIPRAGIGAGEKMVLPRWISKNIMPVFNMTEKEMEEHSSTYWERKRAGNINIELVEKTKSELKGQLFDKRMGVDRLSAGLRHSDAIALADGWNLTKNEVKFVIRKGIEKLKNPAAIDFYQAVEQFGYIQNDAGEEVKIQDIKIGSPEYWKLVDMRSQYVWAASQPSFNQWERTANTSSRGAIKTLFFMFRSYFDTVLSMYDDSIYRTRYDIKKGRKGTRYKRIKNLLTIFMSLAIASMLKDIINSIVRKSYPKKDEEDWMKEMINFEDLWETGDLLFKDLKMDVSTLNAVTSFTSMIPFLGRLAQQIGVEMTDAAIDQRDPQVKEEFLNVPFAYYFNTIFNKIKTSYLKKGGRNIDSIIKYIEGDFVSGSRRKDLAEMMLNTSDIILMLNGVNPRDVKTATEKVLDEELEEVIKDTLPR